MNVLKVATELRYQLAFLSSVSIHFILSALFYLRRAQTDEPHRNYVRYLRTPPWKRKPSTTTATETKTEMIQLANANPSRVTVPFVSWSLSRRKKRSSGAKPVAATTFTRHVSISGLPPHEIRGFAVYYGEYYSFFLFSFFSFSYRVFK